MRKSEFAHAVQVPLARGPAGGHGRHPARIAGGDRAAAGTSRVGNRLGRRACVAGVALCSERSWGATAWRLAASRGPGAPGPNQGLAPSSVQRGNPIANQRVARSTSGRAPTTRCSICREPSGLPWWRRMTGCRRRIGESRPRERAARWLFTERVATRGEHVIEQDVELASAIAGDELVPVKPWLPVDPAAEAWCDDFLRPEGRGPAVLLNPGAGWGAKRWPAGRYAAVASALAVRGHRVFVNSGPGEEPLARSIEAESGGAAAPLTISLSQLIAFTRRVSLVIGGDTGPATSGQRLGPSRGGNLRADRSRPQWAVWNAGEGASEPRKPARSHPPGRDGSGPADHHSGCGAAGCG